MTTRSSAEAITFLMRQAGIDEARIAHCLENTGIERDVLNYLREYSGFVRTYTRADSLGGPDKGWTHTS